MCFLSYSCVYDHTDNIEELGDQYYFLGDGNESQILINVGNSENKKIGKTIVPPEVTHYNYNDNIIIAKSTEQSSSKLKVNYWIINKKEKIDQDSLSAMDSITFYKTLSTFEEKLELKER